VIFSETPLRGVFMVDPQPQRDDRGFFARTWCAREFAAQGLSTQFVQCSVSFNDAAGTLRGLHYQSSPHAEAKLVRCTRGAIYDVVVDLRPHSPTLSRWFAVELTARDLRMLYLPPGCAHGFLTLADDSEVSYQMSQAYQPCASRGVRWNDPALGIRWPRSVRVISDRDATLPLLDEACAAEAAGRSHALEAPR